MEGIEDRIEERNLKDRTREIIHCEKEKINWGEKNDSISEACRNIAKDLKIYATDHKQISLMNISINILKKRLSKRIQQCIKMY